MTDTQTRRQRYAVRGNSPHLRRVRAMRTKTAGVTERTTLLAQSSRAACVAQYASTIDYSLLVVDARFCAISEIRDARKIHKHACRPEGPKRSLARRGTTSLTSKNGADGRTDRRTDGHRTVAERFPLRMRRA